jgi:hypothetical protein
MCPRCPAAPGCAPSSSRCGGDRAEGGECRCCTGDHAIEVGGCGLSPESVNRLSCSCQPGSTRAAVGRALILYEVAPLEAVTTR